MKKYFLYTFIKINKGFIAQKLILKYNFTFLKKYKEIFNFQNNFLFIYFLMFMFRDV